MRNMAKLILIAATGLTAVASCSRESTTSFITEAGATPGGDDFGNATMNNTLIHTGERDYVLDLANRFSREVESTVTFAFNSATLDQAARLTLQQQAKWIKQFPEIHFRVFGHTDLVGSSGYNKRLGMSRARAVVSFLVSQGISRSRLEAVVSRGETQPLIVTQGRERRNRRTVTEVTGFVKGNQMVMDGKYAEIVYRNYVESGSPPTTLSGVDFTSSGGSGGQ